MTLRAVFLDVDGVILDPALNGSESERLCGYPLAAELGGDPVEWGRANQALFQQLWNEHAGDDIADPAAFERALDIALMARLCERFGLAPLDDELAVALSARKDVYVAERMHSQVPGAVAAIRALAVRFALHTATGNPSHRVDALLRGMGVRPLFGVTAGPDLAGIRKYAPGFYAPIFALAGVTPAEAVVVDDHPGALADAAATGAATVYVPRAVAVAESRFDAVVGSIRDLPAAIRAIAAARA